MELSAKRIFISLMFVTYQILKDRRSIYALMIWLSFKFLYKLVFRQNKNNDSQDIINHIYNKLSDCIANFA